MRTGTIHTIAEEAYDTEMAMRTESDAHTRHLREQAQAAENDPALQCHHDVSVFDDCAPCCIEVGDPAPGPGSTSMAALLGVHP